MILGRALSALGEAVRQSADRTAPRCALVTGASSGIGAAFARELPATTGLLLTARDSERLGGVATGLAHGERPVEPLVADLTVAEQRDHVIARAEALEIDLLINNAGLGHLGPALDLPAAAEATTIGVNVVAMAALTRALLPGMIARARQGGHRAGLIIVSSTTAFGPVPYLAAYSASKAFSLYYGEALAEELRAEPVDVLVLCPGPTRTDGVSSSGIPVGRMPGAPRPEQVARRALKALGRRTVLATGWTGRLVLEPLLPPHRAVTAGLGQVMRLVNRRYGPER